MTPPRLLALVVVLACLSPHIAAGQTPANVRRVGVIYVAGPHQVAFDGLRQGLSELGLDEGKHIAFDIRKLNDNLKATVEKAARSLERVNVDLIFTVTTPVTLGVKRATIKVPIVFYVGADPVAAGLVESLAKPGGRLTGVHGRSRELTAKRLEILKEIVPKLEKVVTFHDPTPLLAEESIGLAREAARRQGVQLLERPVRSVEDLRNGLQALKPREAQAYLHTPNALITNQAGLIIDAARARKWPTIFHEESLVGKGGLASYGASYFEIGRISARFVQRIMAGAQPKDLPVENYDRISLVLNLRTAREIGVTFPLTLRARADKLIE